MMEEDWELCKELARFLAAMDESGESLREAMEQVKGQMKNGSSGGSADASARMLEVPSFRSNGLRRQNSETSSQSTASDASSVGTASPL